MGKKLGIDLGSSSLGWSINNDGEFIKKGVVTFDTGMKKGQSGGYVSPTRERREARSKRNLIRARKYRKWALLKILLKEFVPLDNAEFEIWSKYEKGQINKFPENPTFLKWLACDFTYEGSIKYNNPYELRVAALEKKLSKNEFGRALYHVVQRRGYKDIGDTDKETDKQKEKRNSDGFQQALTGNRTIAEALVNDFLSKGKRARNQYPYREEYQEELELICESQGYNITKNDKGEYCDEFIQNIWKAIIWQRPLKAQKGNIGKCTLEPKKLRCPVSHPIFEIFRTWQFINTIKYINKIGEKQVLEQEFSNQLFEWFLNKDANFKFEEIRKFLDKKFGVAQKYNYPIDKDGKYDTSVSGMPVCKGLITILGNDAKKSLLSIEQYNVGECETKGGFGNAPKIVGQYSIYDIWHIIFAFDKRTSNNQDFLENFAKEKLGIPNVLRKRKGSEISISPLVELKEKFLQGYADLSLNAMCKIIPFLKEGHMYDEAVVLAKMPEVLGKDWATIKGKILKLIQESNEIYEWNRTIVSISNNLIDWYKSLDYTVAPKANAEKDFNYTISNYDIKDIENSCQKFFGKASWNNGIDKDRIILKVKNQYQAFFSDPKRTYRELPSLTDIFNKKLTDNKIELRGSLYHHSNRANLYEKNLKIEDGRRIFPKDSKTLIDILPNPRIDSIKNPMFNKSMCILRKLINELLVKGDINSETEIIIEIARELNDNNKRSAIEKYQNERKNNREKYRACLQEFKNKENSSINIEESIPTFEMWTEQIFENTEDENHQPITNNNRLEILKEKDAVKRYELWMEQKGQCMYTGKMISLSNLFSNQIDIEHTIPRSILPDNTLANQTVCYSRYNRDIKNNRIPFECENYSKDTPNGTTIVSRLREWQKLRDYYKGLFEERLKAKGNEDEETKNKRIQDKHYFKMHYDYWKDKVERFEAKEVPDSWVRRQLTDTQMVSKYAREYLKLYFKKVAVQKGNVTAEFRKMYEFQPEDEIKSRNKHTHHAIDATVLTLIPANSSKRDALLKEAYDFDEKYHRQLTKKPYTGFNSQEIISEIENTTLIVNNEKDTILQQTKKKIRVRGIAQYKKDNHGNFILDKEGEKIALISKGNTIRSDLYAQTYLGKIRNVERIDGKPIRIDGEWDYKKGSEEYSFVKREDINKVRISDKLIESIIDPEIRELVNKHKKETIIKDFQGKTIRHVRIKASTGKIVKERHNYISKHKYKNNFYSEAGEVPYAIILQKGNIEREMIPVASYEIAKEFKKYGKFNVKNFINEFYPKYNNCNMKLIKTGQKVIVLKNDIEYSLKNDITFQINRMYEITQFSEGSIWLKYHLNALSKKDVKNVISLIKDEMLRKIEIKFGIPEIKEDTSISDNIARKDDYENRRFRFDTISKSFRLKRISDLYGEEEAKKTKNELDKYKAIPSTIEIEDQTPLLKMSKENWNFLYEGDDFKMNIDGTIYFK